MKLTIQQLPFNLNPDPDDFVIISPFNNLGELNATTVERLRGSGVTPSFDLTGQLSGTIFTLTLTIGGISKSITIELPSISPPPDSSDTTVNNTMIFGNTAIIGNSNQLATIGNNIVFAHGRIGN